MSYKIGYLKDLQDVAVISAVFGGFAILKEDVVEIALNQHNTTLREQGSNNLQKVLIQSKESITQRLPQEISQAWAIQSN